MTCLKINKDGDEITRYGFISHMEDYIKRLLLDPANTIPDDYLLSHGVDGELALSSLLKRKDKHDEESSIMIRKETIKKNPDGGADIFSIKYKVPRKNFTKKMRDLYINLFENYRTDNPELDECDCGACGANSAAQSGQFVQPLTTKPIKRKIATVTTEASKNKKKCICISEEQLKYILNEDEAFNAGGAVTTQTAGDYTFDVPMGARKDGKKIKNPANDEFWGPAMKRDRKNGISTDRLK